ncbi:RHS repeat domain-containing protein, partial [Rugosimonospora acidiphila]
ADITYHGIDTVYTYTDHTTVTYDSNGNTIDEKLADGTDYTNFDHAGHPHHVDIPPGNGNPATSANITYHGTDTVYTYTDHTTVTYDNNGNTIDEKLADGTDYTQFDSNGNPHHVDIPPGNGNPATSANISYHGADTVYTYTDHTVVTYDSSGNITDERLADGTDYTSFDGNGNPHHVDIPPGNGNPATSANISYHGADTVYTYTDHTVVTYDSSGNITDEKLADGTDYTSFDGNGNPHHVDIPPGNGNPATSADIAYHGADTVYTYTDHTVVTYDSSGNITDEKLADGTDYTSFDGNGNPHHVDTPAHDGQPATSADITHVGNDTVYTYTDHTTVTYDNNGKILDERLADGTDYTQFDNNGNPHHVDIPPGNGNPATSADITYHGTDTVYTYTDHTTVTYDNNDKVIDERLADGTDFTQYDGNGTAHHVDIPAHDGQPATSADITYHGADTVYTYTDHTVVTYDGNGKILDEKLADGTDYTRFDANQKPTEVSIPAHGSTPATSAQIAYDNAYTRYTFADKTVLTYQDSNNALVSERLPDGTVYTQFDASQKPHHVDVPAYNGKPATSADISYSDGHVSYTYPDNTVVTYDAASNTLLSQKLPDGTVYSDFDDNEQPHHVEVPPTADKPAMSAAITYDGGHTVYAYTDGSIVTYDTASNTILTERMPDGQVFSDFDKDGLAHHVEIPATDKAPATSADISYDGGHTTYTYPDHTVVTYDTATNTIITEKMADGTVYSDFDGNGAPHHVEIPATDKAPATSADISYDGGHTTYTYPDHTVVTYDTATNTIITEKMADGTVYSDFDGNGNPGHVEIPPQNGKPGTSADITYANGQAIYTYKDGTKVYIDTASNQVVKQEMPDGWVINYVDGKPSSGSNSQTGDTVTITVDKNGDSVWTYSDGTVVYQDPNGNVYKEVANGWTFTEFDGDGKPTYGTMTDSDGNTETVTINYNFDGLGDTQWIYTDDGQTTTIVTDPNGAPISETNKDGTFLFSVELPKLLAAIKTISVERDTINAAMKAIANDFDVIHQDWWTGPGSSSFYSHILDFRNLEQSVASVLSEAIQRMEISYNNYVEAERASDKSLTPIPVEAGAPFPVDRISPGHRIPGLNLGPGPVVHDFTS